MRRSAYIFFMGLLLNAFPHHFDVFSIRILGVLQRIAICYLVSSFLFVTTQARTQAIIMFTLLIGYGCLMALNPAMMLDGNAVGYLDRLVLGSGHLYTPMFDPEGLLSTMPAIASALLGNLIGTFLISSRTKQQKLLWMIGAGLLLALIGWMWAETLPLNKALWSSSYVLWTGGLALLVYAPIYALIEIKQWVRWSRPFDIFGRHAMLVYMLHVLFLKIQAMIHMYNADGAVVGFRVYITDVLFGHFMQENAALCYSITYMTLWLLVLKAIEMSRRFSGRLVSRLG
jgi:predicted acyltransferase